MRPRPPKVLHAIGGRSLLEHAVAAARGTRPDHLVVVVRHHRDLVAEHVTNLDPDVLVADQDEVPGTGRAVECALERLPQDLTGPVLVTYGDVPLLTAETLLHLLEAHAAASAAVTMVTATPADPTGYGRVLRGPDGGVTAVVEHQDADPDQLAVHEVNSGIYAFDLTALRDSLAAVGTSNAQGEKYLTDVIGVAHGRGLTVRAHHV